MALPDIPKHEFDLFDNSIERVINTTISILERIDGKCKGTLAEDVNVNLDDWHNLKTTVVYWWNHERNEHYKKRMTILQENARKQK